VTHFSAIGNIKRPLGKYTPLKKGITEKNLNLKVKIGKKVGKGKSNQPGVDFTILPLSFLRFWDLRT